MSRDQIHDVMTLTKLQKSIMVRGTTICNGINDPRWLFLYPFHHLLSEVSALLIWSIFKKNSTLLILCPFPTLRSFPFIENLDWLLLILTLGHRCLVFLYLESCYHQVSITWASFMRTACSRLLWTSLLRVSCSLHVWDSSLTHWSWVRRTSAGTVITESHFHSLFLAFCYPLVGLRFLLYIRIWNSIPGVTYNIQPNLKINSDSS